MSDKEVSKNTSSDKSNTDKDETTQNSPTKSASSSALTSSTPVTKKTSSSSVTPNKATTNKKKSPVAKDPNKTTKIIASAALLIASVSVAASVAHYFWQQEQTTVALSTLKQDSQQTTQQAIQQSQKQLKNSLTAEFNRQLQQHYNASSQSQQKAQQAYLESEAKLQHLTEQFNQLTEQVSQRDPSDWLIHEAEYLVRIAARTMWLERDTKAAIGLLKDADSRLKELNQPKFLPVRALINEDIESLSLMPVLTNQEAILSAMALNKQVQSLTFSGVNLAEALDEPEEDFELSEDLADWQENLAKTWQKFIKDFISVRRRTGMVEPLMAPEQQEHLKQNLSLKIQLVQWAASEQKEAIYQQTLVDIQQWLNEFFDMSATVNKNFYNAIEALKKETIYYDYPSDLSSLSALKRLLDDTINGKPVKQVEEKLPLEQSDTEIPEQEETSSDNEVSGGQV